MKQQTFHPLAFFSFFFFTFSTLLLPDVSGPPTQGHHMAGSGPVLQLERSCTVQGFWPLQFKRPESFIEHIGQEREAEDKTLPWQEVPSRMEKRLYGGNTQRKIYPSMPATQCRLVREPQVSSASASIRVTEKLSKATDAQGTRQPQTRTPWSVASAQKKLYHPTWLCKGTNAITHRS